MSNLVLNQRPALDAPHLIAGFAGWPDGGGVSTGVVDFLTSYLAAEPIGDIAAHDWSMYTSPLLAQPAGGENPSGADRVVACAHQ